VNADVTMADSDPRSSPDEELTKLMQGNNERPA